MANAVLKKFAQQNALVYDARHMAVYGKYQGYDVVIDDTIQQGQYFINMAVSGRETDFVERTAQFMSTFSFPYTNFAKYENLTITVSVRHKANKDREHLEEVLNALVSYCRSQGLVSCCRYCGAQSGIQAYGVNRKVDMMCGSCFSKVSENLAQAQQEVRAKKGNLLTGLIGAFLFSLVGVALWVLIGQMGKLAAIAGLVIVVCAMKGFEKFGGKMNLGGVTLVSVLSIVMVVLSEAISESVMLTTAFNEEGISVTFFDMFSAFPSLCTEFPELASDFFGNVGIGLLLTVVASVSIVVNTYRNKNLKHELVKLS